MKKYRTLLEAVNGNGLVQVGNAAGFDLYQIQSWEAAQRFVSSANEEQRAGDKWTQNETTFNNNLVNQNNNLLLYFITTEDTNRVICALLGPTEERHNISINGNTVGTINFRIEDVNSHNNIPNLEIVNLIPNVNITLNNEEPHHNEDELQDDAEEDEEENQNELEGPEEAPADIEVLPLEPIPDEVENNIQNDNEQEVNGQVPHVSNEIHDNIEFDDEGNLWNPGTGEILKNVSVDSDWKTPRIKYKKVKNHICITGLRNGYGVFTIPDEIDNLPVTEVAPYSFYNLNYSKIIFPDAVKKIPPYTFINCKATKVAVSRGTQWFKYSESNDDLRIIYKN